MCLGQVGEVLSCSNHDHLLHCGQTVAPRYRSKGVAVYITMSIEHSVY